MFIIITHTCAKQSHLAVRPMRSLLHFLGERKPSLKTLRFFLYANCQCIRYVSISAFVFSEGCLYVSTPFSTKFIPDDQQDMTRLVLFELPNYLKISEYVLYREVKYVLGLIM